MKAHGGQVGRLFLDAMDAPAVSILCKCGEELSFAPNLAGSRGRCPRCDRWLRVPSGKSAGPDSHFMKDLKVASGDPNLAPPGSPYYSAQLYGYVPSVWHLLFWGAILANVASPSAGFVTTFGFHGDEPAWLFGVWGLMALIAGTASAFPVASLYLRHTGRAYAEDRRGYAEAGGFDVVRWAPLVAYLFWFSVFEFLSGRDLGVLGPLRTPWGFLALGTSSSLILSWLVAGRILRARLGVRGGAHDTRPRRYENA